MLSYFIILYRSKLQFQCMNVIAKKVSLSPMIILFFRDCLLIPQVKVFAEKAKQVRANTPQFLPPLIFSRSKLFPRGKLLFLAAR